MSYKAVLFDFDGTLVTSMEDHYRAWKHAFAKFGVDLQPRDLYLLEGQGVKAVAEQMLSRYGISLSLAEEVWEDKKRYFFTDNNVQLYDGAKELLQMLDKEGIKAGVVTGGDRARVVGMLKEFRVWKYFEAVVTADDVKHTKPHPEPFLKGAELLGLQPQNTIVVENAPLGIKAAKKAGAYCMAITTTLNADDLQEADVIASDYYELEERLKNILIN